MPGSFTVPGEVRIQPIGDVLSVDVFQAHGFWKQIKSCRTMDEANKLLVEYILNANSTRL
jgi:hypothetical protein